MMNSDPIPFADDGEHTAPALPGESFVYPSADDAIDAIGEDILQQAIACVGEFGSFHMALSGGNTPMPLYRRMVLDPALRLFPWKSTHLWIVDERCVPFDNEKSNWGHISDLLVDHSGIPRSQVHPMPVVDASGAPTGDDGAAEYERALRAALGSRPEGHRRLDFALLGMGPDGHTASLFPHSRAQAERTKWITTNDGPTVVPPSRMTMTYPLLNSTRLLAVLALGKGKRPTLEKVSAAFTGGDPHTRWRDLPILGIEPVAGALRWYLDHEACEG